MNLLPLELWRQEIGYHPWHFWGLADSGPNAKVPVNSKCNTIVYEHAWQSADELGRAELRSSIETAEKLLVQHMGYNPAPAYNEAIQLWPRYFNEQRYRVARVDAKGGYIPVPVGEGYVQACGIEAYTELADAAALIYTDQDGDGLDDTFMCSVATTITDPSEIGVYFVSGDRLTEDNSLSERWRIQPVQVSFLMGTATIIGKRWLCVKPSLYENKENYPIDPNVAANFITHVSIFRRYTKIDGLVSTTNSQAALIWNGKPCSCCGSSSTDPSSEGWVAARSGVKDKINGIVIPAEAVYNATSGLWSHPCSCTNTCGEPDKVLIRYLAGYDLDSKGWMDKRMRTLVARLACAEMTRRICACDTANREFFNWQLDVSRVEGAETYQANLDTLNNPLGTRRGHLFAWAQIRDLANLTGILM